jgi:membrane-associated phospholipid phosphatase
MKPTVNTNLILALALTSLCGTMHAQDSIRGSASVEPHAGEWKTWIIPSGQAYRLPPPPGLTQTREELDTVRHAVVMVDQKTLERVKHWDAGSPAYRWIDLLEKRINAGTPTTAHPHRPLTYVAMAIYDATVAAWDSKYAHNRPRPTALDPDLRALVEVPNSPSYPSEHAAAAAAAAGVLSWFLPGEASAFQAMAEEAGRSRVLAGVQYPSDVAAGMELGRQVAQAVIARAAADGYTTAWGGAVPTGKCKWTGVNPGNASATGWKPILMSWPGELRPAAPPDCESVEIKAEVGAVKSYQRTFNSNMKAYYWQSPEGRETWNFTVASRWMFEDGMDRNAPRAARAYALIAAAHYETIVPLVASPNFPSYPSNHSSFSWGRAEILAYLFPGRAETARAQAHEAGESRIWAGIHYAVDLAAGKTLGAAVARKFIEWAERDGSK